MYKFNEENYKENIRNHYLIVFVSLFIGCVAILKFLTIINAPDIILNGFIYIYVVDIFFSCIFLITMPFYFRNVKNVCKDYNFHITGEYISYHVHTADATSIIYTETDSIILINKVIKYKEFKGRLIIKCNYTKKSVTNNKRYEEKNKKNSYVSILKGIDNIEEFKQELEKLKNG
ncbi:MAG: hypothetical protein Q4Q31_04225 [Bacillota bacterium]|nr:hypothetical protein [Bacillota bacterium]